MSSACRKIDVKLIEPEDLQSIVSIHRAAFPNTALSRLGEGTVRRYYLWQMRGPHGVSGLVALVREARVGFLIGGVFQGALTGFLRRHKWYLAFLLLVRPWLLFHSRFWRKIRTALRLLLASPKAPVRETSSPEVCDSAQFTVLAVAVHPDFQRLGIGKCLMDLAERKARESGATEMHLTVEPENTPAIRLYERLGYERTACNGVWHGQMRKSLRPKAM